MRFLISLNDNRGNSRSHTAAWYAARGVTVEPWGDDPIDEWGTAYGIIELGSIEALAALTNKVGSLVIRRRELSQAPAPEGIEYEIEALSMAQHSIEYAADWTRQFDT